MREIVLIFSMLILGIFSARAFGAYTPTTQDSELLESLYNKVDTLEFSQPTKLQSIHQKLPAILTLIQDQPRALHILTELFLYIDHRYQTQEERSPELLRLLAKEV